MTIRSIPDFLKCDPIDLGYPISHQRKLRVMLGVADPWQEPPAPFPRNAAGRPRD